MRARATQRDCHAKPREREREREREGGREEERARERRSRTHTCVYMHVGTNTLSCASTNTRECSTCSTLHDRVRCMCRDARRMHTCADWFQKVQRCYHHQSPKQRMQTPERAAGPTHDHCTEFAGTLSSRTGNRIQGQHGGLCAPELHYGSANGPRRRLCIRSCVSYPCVQPRRGAGDCQHSTTRITGAANLD